MEGIGEIVEFKSAKVKVKSPPPIPHPKLYAPNKYSGPCPHYRYSAWKVYISEYSCEAQVYRGGDTLPPPCVRPCSHYRYSAWKVYAQVYRGGDTLPPPLCTPLFTL